MTLAALPPLFRWILSFATVAAIAALSLTWIPFASIGGFDLLLPYAVVLGLGAVLLLFPGTIAIAWRFLPPSIVLWLVTYLAYLLVLQFSLSGGETKGIVLRQMFFMSCGIIFGLAIIALQANGGSLRKGGALAILGFVGVSEVMAWQLGLSWVTVIQTLITTGNLEFVFYQFLKKMFELVLPLGEEAQASDKNAVSVALLTALILFRAGWRGPASDVAGQLMTVATLAILLVLNTRSVLLVAVVILPFAGWIAVARGGIRDTGRFVLKTVFLAGLGLAGVVLVMFATAGEPVMGGRFAFDDDSTLNRFGQYAWAMQRIEASPWIGSGLAEFKGQPVHNLFLGAWMHAGFLAFLLVVFAYLAMLTGWVLFVMRAATQRGYWVLDLRAEWVAMLPLVPLFRMWIAGDSGHPSFVEWMALFGFAAFILANRAAKAQQSLPRRHLRFRQGAFDAPG